MKKTVLLLLLLAITITSCMAQRPARHNGGVILGDLTGTSSDPTATKVGQIYWNDTNKEFRTWNGTAWKSLNDIEGISSSGTTYDDLLLDFGGIGYAHPSFRLDQTTKQISFYSPIPTGENIIINGGLLFDRYKVGGGTSDQVMLADGTFASLSGMGGSNIFTADGVTPDSSTRFLDLGLNANFYLRSNDYSNYIWLNSNNLELRNVYGDIRMRTGAAGTLTPNTAGQVWTARNTVGDGYWADASVSKTGTPVNEQLAIWTADGIIEGTNNLKFNNTIALLNIGNEGANRGQINLTGNATGSYSGAAVYLETADDHDTTVDNYIMQVYGEDFKFGSNVGTLLEYDFSATRWKIADYGDGAITGTATYNLAVDTNGNIIEEPLTKYKSYVAIINQIGTATPTAIVLENSLSGTPVITRTQAGTFHFTLTGEFTADKTVCFISEGSLGYLYNASANRLNGDIVNVSIADNSDTLIDGLSGVSFEIRVYP